MKKKLLMLGTAICALCLALTLASCGGDNGGSDNKSDANSGSEGGERTTFTVGFDQNFPPYGYLENGKHVGFDLDLAAEVAKRNGWEVEYRPIEWDAKDLELKNGNIDCIWNGFTIESRENDYAFTDPYMDNTQVVVVKKDAGINSLADLEGKIVMAQADSAAWNLLVDEKGQKQLADTFDTLQSVPEYNSAFLELEGGMVDAVALDLPVAEFQISGKTDLFVILDEALSTEHYGVGFRLDDTELRDTVQATLKEMVADGFVEQVAEKYADQGISYERWCLEA